MEIRHLEDPRPMWIARKFPVEADVRLDLLASMAAALATGLATYVLLRTARALMEKDEAEMASEVEAEATRAHRPLFETVP